MENETHESKIDVRIVVQGLDVAQMVSKAVSNIQLENDYGFRIRSLSYPNGDYSDRDVEIAKQAGYECGVTVDAGYNDRNADLFRLKRVSVNDAKTLDELIVKASGCFILLKHVLRA